MQSDGDIKTGAGPVGSARGDTARGETAPDGARGGTAPEGPAPQGTAAWTRKEPGGWFEVLGLEILSSSATEVIAEWTVGPRHLQPHGIVHGGVYASVVETCCSVGALLAAPSGRQVVGVENHTSFLRPIRDGRLRACARPLHAGRQAQLWECNITDPEERLVATGRLRVFCIEAPPERSRQP